MASAFRSLTQRSSVISVRSTCSAFRLVHPPVSLGTTCLQQLVQNLYHIGGRGLDVLPIPDFLKPAENSSGVLERIHEYTRVH